MKKHRQNWKKAVCLLLTLLLLAACVGCGDVPLTTGRLAALRDENFGAAYLDITIDEFNKLGFSYGDSVDVSFSNGFRLEDIPYYDGYYTKTDEPLICAYPGYPYIAVCYNNGPSLWTEAGLSEGDTGTVTLRARGKYKITQETLSLRYSNERSSFPSDAAFANFRAMTGGNLRENVFFRSASPCNNEYSRAGYVDALMGENGVNFILNLADNEEEVAGYMAGTDFGSENFLRLYESGQVALLDLAANYRAEDYAKKLADGLRTLCGYDGPYLVHCTEGKDRTGFVCILLEALAGASYDEMIADYMITYDNYYGITLQSDPEKYQTVAALKADDMLYYISGLTEGESLQNVDFTKCAEEYLRFGGLADAEIVLLKEKICSYYLAFT